MHAQSKIIAINCMEFLLYFMISHGERYSPDDAELAFMLNERYIDLRIIPGRGSASN